MTDRRFRAANDRVAAAEYTGPVDAQRRVEGEPLSVTAAVLDLCAAPGGARDRQLLRGARLRCFEEHEGHAFVQAADGYVGYVAASGLGPATNPTHRVTSRATHAYAAADMKSPERLYLSMGAQVTVMATDGPFAETDAGHVPVRHLHPLKTALRDPAALAEQLLGTPYLWGGNSALGIDCSGLVTAAFEPCGLTPPADSDLQRDQLGNALPADAPLERNDLVFWQGHVGIMLDANRLIHANAHHMAVATEPLAEATARIADREDSPVLARKRVVLAS